MYSHKFYRPLRFMIKLSAKLHTIYILVFASRDSRTYNIFFINLLYKHFFLLAMRLYLFSWMGTSIFHQSGKLELFFFHFHLHSVYCKYLSSCSNLLIVQLYAVLQIVYSIVFNWGGGKVFLAISHMQIIIIHPGTSE